MKRLIAALALLAVAGCAITGGPPAPVAAPVAKLTQGGVTIILSEEPCALPAVKNLAYRAAWIEAGGGFEGCYTLQLGALVVLYFSDRTVVVVPLAMFQRPAATAPPAGPRGGIGI